MTCIVGLVKRGTVWLGADSAGTDGRLQRTIIKDPKVFVRGDIAFGVCGSPKVMDALAHSIQLPHQVPGINDREFLVGELVPAIRAGLVKLDAASSTDSGVQYEGEMLVGYRGALYKLQGNFQLIQSADGFDSTGSGGQLALGSLRATRNVGNPKKRLLTALEASTANAGCAPPFVIVSVNSNRSFWK